MARPKKYTEKWLKRLMVKMLRYIKATDLPLKQDFAYQNKFSSQRISEWANEYRWFAEAIKRFEDACIYKWLIAKDINPAVKIFTLKNIAGWRDDQVVVDNSQHTHLTWKENGKVIDRDRLLTALAPIRNTRASGEVQGVSDGEKMGKDHARG